MIRLRSARVEPARVRGGDIVQSSPGSPVWIEVGANHTGLDGSRIIVFKDLTVRLISRDSTELVDVMRRDPS